jgi:hypothetical protein
VAIEQGISKAIVELHSRPGSPVEITKRWEWMELVTCLAEFRELAGSNILAWAFIAVLQVLL